VDILEDQVRFGIFFSGRVFCTRRGK
jgi:hypothetical protein